MVNFVVYIHIRPDKNEPFYVGMGIKGRENKICGRNKHWKNIVNKNDYVVDVTHKGLCREEACSIEKYLIDFYRIHSNHKLCNVTNGGDGTDTETAILFNKIRWSDPKQKENLIKQNKLRFSNIEERKKISENNKKRFESLEERKKISDNNKKRFSDTINREKNKNSMKNFWANLTPERRLEITNKMKKPKRKNYV